MLSPMAVSQREARGSESALELASKACEGDEGEAEESEGGSVVGNVYLPADFPARMVLRMDVHVPIAREEVRLLGRVEVCRVGVGACPRGWNAEFDSAGGAWRSEVEMGVGDRGGKVRPGEGVF